jgi:hypothetical protein
VGDLGIILSTTDGGKNWKMQRGGVEDTPTLRSVQFLEDGQRGWAVGNNHTILATGDGGKNWSVQSRDTEGRPALYSVQFLEDGRRGWAVGGGTILTTVDGGKSWTTQRDISTEVLFSVQFLAGGQQGWVVGSNGTILFTNDFRSAPFVSDITVQSGIGGTVLTWQVNEEQKTFLRCLQLEYRFRATSWQPINSSIELLGNGRCRARWNPSAAGVPVGEKVFYRVTLEGAEQLRYQHEIAQGFRTSSLWDSLSKTQRTALISFGAVMAYVLVLLLLLYIKPTLLLPLLKLPWPTLGNRYPAKLVLGTLLVPWLTNHPRTRSAWIQRFREDRTNLAKLKPPVRAEYVTHQDVQKEWVAHYRNGKASFSDLDAESREIFFRSPFVLDAWVQKHRTTVALALEHIGAVAARRIYIPVPVKVGDRETGKRLADQPGPNDFRAMFGSTRSVIAIVGEGGSGKSTLAFALARWALAATPEERLAEHLMIPVVLLEETQDMLQSVRRYLRQIIVSEDTGQDLIEALLSQRRLLVICDSLSERRPETQQYVQGIHGCLPVNTLVVTTRHEPNFGVVSRDVVVLRPELLSVEKLAYFLTEYLQRRGADSTFVRRAPFQLGDKILSMVEAGSKRTQITPLLVKVFVDTALEEVKRGKTLEELPQSIPDAIIAYLQNLNPNASDAPDFVPTLVIIRAAKILAKVSLSGSYIPHDFTHEDAEKKLLSHVDTRKDSTRIIARLLQNGVLAQRLPAGTSILCFNLDPIAEYLAALYYVEKLAGDVRDWDEWLKEIERLPNFPKEIIGFLIALENCILAYRSDFKTPENILAWIRSVTESRF